MLLAVLNARIRRGSLLRLNLLALHLSYIVQQLLELISYPHNMSGNLKHFYFLCPFFKALLIYYLPSAVLYIQLGLRIQVKLFFRGCSPSFLSLHQQGIAREQRIRGCSHQNMMLRSAALQQCMKWRVSFCCSATGRNKLFFFPFPQNLV